MKKDFLYKAAEMLFNRFAKKDAKQKWLSAQVKGNLERLYPFSGKEKIREYYIQKIRFSLLLCLIGVILTGGMLLAEILQPVVKENKICRQLQFTGQSANCNESGLLKLPDGTRPDYSPGTYWPDSVQRVYDTV